MLNPFSQKQFDFFIGTPLCDVFLETCTKIKGDTWRYGIHHSRKQEAYLIHKHQIIKNLCSRDIYFYSSIIKEQKIYIKVVPSNIEKYLTPRAITYWHMDDGSWHKRKNYVLFCTHSFSIDEVNILCTALRNLYKIEPSLRLARRKTRLTRTHYLMYIPAKDSIIKLPKI